MIKEKIGFYKTLITLSWTAFIVLAGGTYKVYQTHEIWLFRLALIGIIILMTICFSLVYRTKYWIKKLED